MIGEGWASCFPPHTHKTNNNHTTTDNDNNNNNNHHNHHNHNHHNRQPPTRSVHSTTKPITIKTKSMIIRSPPPTKTHRCWTGS